VLCPVFPGYGKYEYRFFALIACHLDITSHFKQVFSALVGTFAYWRFSRANNNPTMIATDEKILQLRSYFPNVEGSLRMSKWDDYANFAD
jgi:hypothetical protein